MTSNPNIDLNSLLAEVIEDEKLAAEQADEARYTEIKNLMKAIVDKVRKANEEDDPRPALQAILDGSGEYVEGFNGRQIPKNDALEFELEATKAQLLEADKTIARQKDELEEVRKDNQQLRTDKGRLETELKDAKAKSAVANRKQQSEPVPPAKPSLKDRAKQALANAQS